MSRAASPAGDGIRSEHDPAGDLPQPGRHLLEASAGTGKTFAIAALVTRLVAEEGIPIDQVLVVTFTRAAAAELRDRIRRRLVDASRALPVPPEGDDDVVHRRLVQGSAAALHERGRRLDQAVVDFDTSTITTIHGFCQQVLQTLGATSGHNPDALLVQDTTDLVHGACADLLTVAALSGVPGMGLDSLVSAVTTVLGNPGVEVVAASRKSGDLQRRDLVDGCAQAVRDRLGSTGSLSYDGILEAVRDALRAHPDAAARVAVQFPVALVDEFQDTDPVQWDILQRIYTVEGAPRPGTRLVLVGDPKQAIYGFRGGDIHTYLAAAAGATTTTLPVNWRSDGALLSALNGLCDGWRLGEDAIRYHQVRPAPGHERRGLTDGDGSPLSALEVRCAAAGLEPSKPTKAGKCSIPADPARWACIDDVARCIVELLNSGVRIPCPDGARSDGARPGGAGSDGAGPEVPGTPTRPLHAGDIAVLVHANRWTHAIQRALVRAGVPAVVTGGSSVTESPAADQWRILLDALARPSDPTRARAVALSWLGDRDPTWVASGAGAGVDGDDRLAELQSRLDAWSLLVRSEGVSALLAAVRTDARLAASILSIPDGERGVTDFEHIGELLHKASAGRPVGPETLRALLGELATSDDDDPEAVKRRVDSDAPAVRIMTLHAAKGLEFPVVCCPSLWSLGERGVGSRRLYHTDEGRRLDVSASSADVKAEQGLALAEVVGQDHRLTYVGMTRAVHRLVVWWAATRSAHKSPVAPLLFGDADVALRPAEHPGQIRERLDSIGLHDVTLVDVLPHGSGVPRVSPAAGPPGPAADTTTALEVARLGRVIDRSVSRWSFTAISARAVDRGPVPDAVASAPAVGDPDDPTLGDASDADEQALGPPIPFDGLGAGAVFGTLVHDALEHVDFTGDLEAQLGAFLSSRRAAGDATRRDGLVHAIATAIRTPLGAPFDDLPLSSLASDDRLDELEFELPLGSVAAGVRVDTAEIGRVLVAHCRPDDPLRSWARQLADDSIALDVSGYLTGSIDLVLRRPAAVPGGHRYSVVDYKTNRLGAWAVPDRISNYDHHHMTRAMAEHHYPLQAVLYCVALHRFLRWRLTGYDPSVHLGPVGYLFVRGMVGPGTPVLSGRRHGVFDWSIPASAVVALSDLLDGSGAPRVVSPS